MSTHAQPGFTCAAEGYVLDENGRYEISNGDRVGTCVVFSLLAVFLWKSAKLRWNLDRNSGALQREFWVAFRSGVVYLLMIVPLVWHPILHAAPQHLANAYKWLPFWYSFMMAASMGGCMNACWEALLGSFIAIIAAAFLNGCMPGGAGPNAFKAEFIDSAWVSGGYSPERALAFAALFGYWIYASSFGTATKMYALGSMSTMLVMFMNPAQSEEVFQAVIFDLKGNINWQSYSLCQLYLYLVAALLSVLTLPLSLSNPFRPNEICSDWVQVVQGLSDIATDTVGTLDRLMVHFREGTSAYGLESSYLYIRELGSRRSTVERQLENSKWEGMGAAAQRKIDYAKRLSSLLRGLRQVLRIELEHLKGHGASSFEPVHAAEITLYLDDFSSACRDALATVSDMKSIEAGQLDKKCKQEVLETANRGDKTLVFALRKLEELRSSSQPAEDKTTGDLCTEMAFVDCLRTCRSLIDEFLREQPPRKSCLAEWGEYMRDLVSGNKIPSKKTNRDALRSLLSWLIGLAWSLYVRPYKAACAGSVAFVFSPSVGSLFDRNMNRMVGIAIGLTMGNIPALLLMVSESHHGTHRRCFKTFPHGILMYMISMLLMWTAAMYGYMASGAKYSYACLLWAGFGGTYMLQHLFVLSYQQGLSPESYGDLFMDVMDNFVGCFIVFLVDIGFAHLTGGLASRRVASIVPKAVYSIGNVVQGFRTAAGGHQDSDLSLVGSPGTVASPSESKASSVHPSFRFLPQDVDIRSLQLRIAEARFWDDEVQKEDLVWNMLKDPYRKDFIMAILDQCDNAYVAAYSIQVSAARIQECSDKPNELKTLEEVLPRPLISNARLYARAVRSALSGTFQEAEAQLLDAEMPTSPQISSSEAWERDLQPHQDMKLMRMLSFVGDGLTEEAITTAAAKMSLRTSAWDLRQAVCRIEMLIKDHAFWACGDWNKDDDLRRDISDGCGDDGTDRYRQRTYSYDSAKGSDQDGAGFGDEDDVESQSVAPSCARSISTATDIVFRKYLAANFPARPNKPGLGARFDGLRSTGNSEPLLSGARRNP
eukprot:TRINITY_DN12780_c0_g1_i1.p1 TRINITY_DN12780_c0_g1~~TRINITY_DN12780_c0_g1_i1.p1  ORF type:complete len:1051 (+),score=209.68 TRINITY_DN12780_c0_g1_i1:94-3246(+)